MNSFSSDRYASMQYRRCGHTGLDLPEISLGLWQNFGETTPFDRIRELCRHAFDLGITHFDLANNYGPPAGSAERNFGELLSRDFRNHRDEMVISTKAGYRMWDGPYGEWGSRKYLISSLDQSLMRLGIDYVDIFYSHRADPRTPLEETMGALDAIVRQGKALYVGISSYGAERTAAAAAILKRLGTPCIIHQPSYSMLNRWIETDGLLPVLDARGMGCIAFSPLAQGILTNKYLGAPPAAARVHTGDTLSSAMLNSATIERVRGLDAIARRRGQNLAQMAIAWVLRDPGMTSALVGVSRSEQLDDCVGALGNLSFDADELVEIDRFAVDSGLNLWAQSSSVPAG
ncbi:MAG: L-glyceraldehyde 3-phosphate reductase [Devosia sp.]